MAQNYSFNWFWLLSLLLIKNGRYSDKSGLLKYSNGHDLTMKRLSISTSTGELINYSVDKEIH